MQELEEKFANNFMNMLNISNPQTVLEETKANSNQPINCNNNNIAF